MEAVAATAAPAEAQDARARAGNREALDSLYRPHFEAVYDFVVRVVGERELAADVVRRTFAEAQGDTACLFATARECALDSLRYRRHRNGDEREALHFTRIDGDRVPDAAVFDQQLAELVWDAVAALPREEYSLLALHLRHGVSAEELGEPATRVTRLCETLDERVTFQLVARRSRHTCTELEILTARAQADERELAQHIRRCGRCGESSRAFVAPSAVLGSLKLIAPPRGLRREVFKRSPRRRRFGIL